MIEMPNKGAAANRLLRSGFDALDFMMILFQMLLAASRSLSLVRSVKVRND
jgi:hypothetical protein